MCCALQCCHMQVACPAQLDIYCRPKSLIVIGRVESRLLTFDSRLLTVVFGGLGGMQGAPIYEQLAAVAGPAAARHPDLLLVGLPPHAWCLTCKQAA